MAEFFTDEQIKACIGEPKPLPVELGDLTLPLRNTRAGHKEAQYDVTGTSGTDYRIIIRQSVHNLVRLFHHPGASCRKLPTRCFGCVGTMEKAMSTPIRSNAIGSIPSICTRPHSVIRNEVSRKTASLSRPSVMAI